jgi:hypothetical protein
MLKHNIFQSILFLLLINNSIALGLIDKDFHEILSLLFFNISIAFLFTDNVFPINFF